MVARAASATIVVMTGVARAARAKSRAPSCSSTPTTTFLNISAPSNRSKTHRTRQTLPFHRDQARSRCGFLRARVGFAPLDRAPLSAFRVVRGRKRALKRFGCIDRAQSRSAVAPTRVAVSGAAAPDGAHPAARPRTRGNRNRDTVREHVSSEQVGPGRRQFWQPGDTRASPSLPSLPQPSRAGLAVRMLRQWPPGLPLVTGHRRASPRAPGDSERERVRCHQGLGQAEEFALARAADNYSVYAPEIRVWSFLGRYRPLLLEFLAQAPAGRNRRWPHESSRAMRQKSRSQQDSSPSGSPRRRPAMRTSLEGSPRSRRPVVHLASAFSNALPYP